MKKIILVGFCCLMWQNPKAQNNAIFEGGVNQGYHKATFSQNLNNKIFIGGEDDGYGKAHFSQSINSRIFWGGNGQGYVQGHFSQAINNPIFGGGIEDGYAQLKMAMASNNSIFMGGISPGYDLATFIQASNNNIFDGGVDEGYDYVRIEGLPAALNPVFPIELLSFDAWPEKEQVHIEWVTASEVNHDYFQVERSQDTKISEVIGLVWGQGGRQQVQAYELKDPEPLSGYSFYRLQSFDKNGQMELSSWVEVFFEEGQDLIMQVFPNPTTDLLSVRIKGDNPAYFELEIFDLMGRPLGYKQEFREIKGGIETQMSLAELPVGIYILRLQNKGTGESLSYRIKVLR